ncbi:hypothetical protein NQ318_001782 [Aromia moschata]|uniref:Uncharacterized protein n=1 Tax=Aromia moschata TaxID=1265417 RepID=A0AAV8XI06_9CUCU|nr:hypothetical protein NQ318_001782 [Aromia moschata]
MSSDIAVCNFNGGLKSILQIIKVLEVEIGPQLYNFCIEADVKRVQRAEASLSIFLKHEKVEFTDKPNAKVQTQPSKGLDFTDDPFRDYRYEDPFNFSFEDEAASEKKDKSKSSVDSFSADSGFFGKQDKFDPFGLDGRQSVPLPSSDPFVSVSGRASAPISSELLSEDQQLAWAARESLKLEEARRKRQQQEQADLELAITLSKAERI